MNYHSCICFVIVKVYRELCLFKPCFHEVLTREWSEKHRFKKYFFNVSANWILGHPTPGTYQGLNNDDLTPGRVWNMSLCPAPWSGVCRQTEKRKDWSKGVCYRRTKGYTGKTIPKQDWNLLPWPVTKCYRASFNSSAFSSNSSPHTWLLSLICEFIWVTRKDGFCNEPLHVTKNSNWGVFYLVVI